MIDISLPWSDIDECSENRDDCEHVCANNVGSYSCTCQDGYRLDANGRTCNGI